MESLVNALLSNALVATGLALAPLVLSRFGRSPALVHSLWLVVLLKLVTPPLVQVPLAISSYRAPSTSTRGRRRCFQAHPGGAARIGKNCPPTWSRTTVSPLSVSGMELLKALSPRSRPETRNWVRRAAARASLPQPTRQNGLMRRTLMQRTTLPRSPCAIFRAGKFLPWR